MVSTAIPLARAASVHARRWRFLPAPAPTAASVAPEGADKASNANARSSADLKRSVGLFSRQ